MSKTMMYVIGAVVVGGAVFFLTRPAAGTTGGKAATPPAPSPGTRTGDAANTGGKAGTSRTGTTSPTGGSSTGTVLDPTVKDASAFGGIIGTGLSNAGKSVLGFFGG